MFQMKSPSPILPGSNLSLPSPAKYFRKGERHFHYLAPTTGLWWDGNLGTRGDTVSGIPPELRRESDYRDVEGVVTLRSPFYPSEYTEQTLRRRKVTKLSKDASGPLLQHFQTYRDEWNRLVRLDRASTLKLNRGDRTHRDYSHRRGQHPLRLKSKRRVSSIPITPAIRAVLKQHLKLDWRTVQSPRLIRFGKQVALSYVSKETHIHEVNLEDRTLNSCRDPRLCDVGVCLSQKGMTLQVQNPTDDHQGFHTPIGQLGKQSIDSLVAELRGKARVVALDPYCPPQLRDTKAYLIRKLRTLQAEGAIEFRSPRLALLGATYQNLPSYHPQHLKVWQRNHMKEWFDYARIQGLTGRSLMVKEAGGNLVGVDGRQIHPLTRANHILQSAMAKLGLWHGATFLRSVSGQRVRSAFHRYRCEQQRRAEQPGAPA
jgi:hypothetical protein